MTSKTFLYPISAYSLTGIADAIAELAGAMPGGTAPSAWNFVAYLDPCISVNVAAGTGVGSGQFQWRITAEWTPPGSTDANYYYAYCQGRSCQMAGGPQAAPWPGTTLGGLLPTSVTVGGNPIFINWTYLGGPMQLPSGGKSAGSGAVGGGASLFGINIGPASPQAIADIEGASVAVATGTGFTACCFVDKPLALWQGTGFWQAAWFSMSGGYTAMIVNQMQGCSLSPLGGPAGIPAPNWAGVNTMHVLKAPFQLR